MVCILFAKTILFARRASQWVDAGPFVSGTAQFAEINRAWGHPHRKGMPYVSDPGRRGNVFCPQPATPVEALDKVMP